MPVSLSLCHAPPYLVLSWLVLSGRLLFVMCRWWSWGRWCAGHLVDAMLTKVGADKALSVHDLWRAVMYGFEYIWPETRTKIGSVGMGDVWTYTYVATAAQSCDCRGAVVCVVLAVTCVL